MVLVRIQVSYKVVQPLKLLLNFPTQMFLLFYIKSSQQVSQNLRRCFHISFIGAIKILIKIDGIPIPATFSEQTCFGFGPIRKKTILTFFPKKEFFNRRNIFEKNSIEPILFFSFFEFFEKKILTRLNFWSASFNFEHTC